MSSNPVDEPFFHWFYLHILTSILLDYPSYISYSKSWENVFKNQGILFLMIISFILVTCMFGRVVIS